MGAVPVDLAAARAAVEVTAQRAADLVRSLPDPSVRVPGLDWTVGQTAAHLVAAARYYPRYATGQAAPEATIDLADGNLERIAQVGERGLAELADQLIAETQRLLVLTADLAPDHRVAFHGGTSLDLAAQTGILLGEFLIHGLDLARSVPRPWPINPDDARLVIAAATALLPRYVDPEAARGITVGYDVRIRGGPRFGLQLTDGAATVVPGAVGSVDCHISADPVAFLVVAYGRGSLWPPIIRGKLTSWGRKPWRALGLTRLLVNP
jgi:uncharacterized protein (TIGR03083 family)